MAPLFLEFLEAFEETLDDFGGGVDAAVVANQLDDEDAVCAEVALDEPGEEGMSQCGACYKNGKCIKRLTALVRGSVNQEKPLPRNHSV